jgi:hypothetical protein
MIFLFGRPATRTGWNRVKTIELKKRIKDSTSFLNGDRISISADELNDLSVAGE